MKKTKQKAKTEKNQDMQNIPNPKKRSLQNWILILIISIFIFLKSYISFEMNSLDGLLIMLSAVFGLTAIIFIPITIKSKKQIDAAIQKAERIVLLEYDAKEWENYIINEKNFRIKEGKKTAKLLSIITILIFIPFTIIMGQGEIFLITVMVILLAIYAFMAIIFPKITSQMQKSKTKRAIILKKRILIGNQFHTWDFPLSLFHDAKHNKKPYEHIAITYDFTDRTGPRKYTVNVPIPKKFKGNPKDIIIQLEKNSKKQKNKKKR
jgi:Ca2+/Na+ antiporter